MRIGDDAYNALQNPAVVAGINAANETFANTDPGPSVRVVKKGSNVPTIIIVGTLAIALFYFATKGK